VAGEHSRSHLRGVLDGDLSTSNITAAERRKQTQSDIDIQIATQHALNAAAILTHQPTSPHPITTATSPSGNGYQFDTETITKRITDWHHVLNDIKADEVELRLAQNNVIPPSPDKPAADNAKATLASIQAAIDQNFAMQQYAQAWLDALHKANGTYVEHDQDTRKRLSDTRSATDGSGLNS
jgi:hypothetical protein